MKVEVDKEYGLKRCPHCQLWFDGEAFDYHVKQLDRQIAKHVRQREDR